ncbi:MAG: hypothetical protein R3B06_00705 [Kofleriaceae bacterium]
MSSWLRLSVIVTVVIAALAYAPAPSAAETCKAAEGRALKLMRRLDAAGQGAVTIGARCMFHGTDAKAVAKLSTIARSTFADLGRQGPPDPACVKVGAFDKAVGTLANSMGQRLGLAWALCSAEAQATVEAMTAKQAPQADIEAAVGKLAQAWLTDQLK